VRSVLSSDRTFSQQLRERSVHMTQDQAADENEIVLGGRTKAVALR